MNLVKNWRKQKFNNKIHSFQRPPHQYRQNECGGQF